MLAYVIRRLAYGVVVVFGVLLLLFMLFFGVTEPDDIARRALGEKALPEVIEQWKENHGYDKALWPWQNPRENLLHFRLLCLSQCSKRSRPTATMTMPTLSTRITSLSFARLMQAKLPKFDSQCSSPSPMVPVR